MVCRSVEQTNEAWQLFDARQPSLYGIEAVEADVAVTGMRDRWISGHVGDAGMIERQPFAIFFSKGLIQRFHVFGTRSRARPST